MAALKNIAIVGAGHMGIAIALGLRRSNPHISIGIIDSDPEKHKNISGANISLLAGLPDAPTFEALILAIPPQAFNSFSHNNPQLKSLPTLMISVMAGVTISELEKHLKTSQVCRAIPNLPCAINEGVTVLMPPSNYHAKKQIISHPNSFTAWHVNHDARRESY
ncbi:pyrroline-5-carboxylate reductase family protein [Pseudomonas lurida]|uniref:pyrroline-5-carboxylate reductase family protein n=1 Tax=Pseudomonas lurida TaxID=244566 RepID=UPI003D28CCFF